MKTQNEITEADVASFLFAKRAELVAATGIPESVIDVSMSIHGDSIEWRSYSSGGDYTKGNTVSEAIAAQVATLSSAGKMGRAKERRELAARLIAEAEQLEGNK